MSRSPSFPGSLGRIFTAHSGWMRRKLAAKAIANDEDLTQETFLRLATHPPADEIRHPKALLMTVAGNLARDAQRRQRRQGGAHLSLEEAYAEHEPFADGDQETALLLKQIILTMPRLYRDVFVLSRFAGLSYEEIADRCGLSVKTVEWRMSKALAHCSQHLRA